MVGPFERLLVAAARHDHGLPRRAGRDGGDTIELTLVGGRIDDVGCRSGYHEMDALIQDEVARKLGSLVRVRLRVAVEDFHLIGLAADLKPVGEAFAHLRERV